MSNKIQGQWDQDGFDLDDFRASISAVQEYRPLPEITLSLSGVKGMTQEHLESIIRMLDQDEVKYTVTLSAVRPSEHQLRLFGPGNPAHAVAAAERQLGINGQHEE